MLLGVFAAAFLGLTTIQPGRFNAIGAGISIFFLATGELNGMNLLGASSYVQSLFDGVVLVIAVVASRRDQPSPCGRGGCGSQHLRCPERRSRRGSPQSSGLRQLILDGELKAGDRLSEVRLASRLDVSRTPLRLALAQLEHEGLLSRWPAAASSCAPSAAARSTTRSTCAVSWRARRPAWPPSATAARARSVS